MDRRAIVEGDLRIAVAARRNFNVRIERRRGRGWLIKQPKPGASGARGTLRKEARFYRFCSDEASAAPVRAFLPGLERWLPEESTLVLELIEGGRGLWAEYREHEPADFPCGPLRALGRALGILHRTFRLPGLATDPRLGKLGEDVPGFFAIHRPEPETLRKLSSAQLQLCRVVQTEDGFAEGLEAVAADWRVTTLIHGDIRSENVLVLSPEPEPAEPVLLLDWEFVRRGDEAWDLASVLGDTLHFWMRGMSLRSDLDPAERLATAEYLLAVLQRGLRACWRGYLAAAGVKASLAPALLRRSVAYSAGKLLQSAWEISRRADRLSSLAVLLLQLSSNIVANPGRAAVELYGLADELAEA